MTTRAVVVVVFTRSLLPLFFSPQSEEPLNTTTTTTTTTPPSLPPLSSPLSPQHPFLKSHPPPLTSCPKRPHPHAPNPPPTSAARSSAPSPAPAPPRSPSASSIPAATVAGAAADHADADDEAAAPEGIVVRRKDGSMDLEVPLTTTQHAQLLDGIGRELAEQQRVAAELVKRHQVDAYKKLPELLRLQVLSLAQDSWMFESDEEC
ncbi:uncharacterized protein LAJ45_01715 [Morchella importuna]|uniref:uncharacterized protein n=1 Tax=Morchella importuna TaxID=1174673 RepID=UPI001E8E13FC|nr:uncharacterized protein LAJ45_01715 [Morchella importuna]KAH8153948.1 hypothetical protein LAJ45_01715 [Morchella importuna]